MRALAPLAVCLLLAATPLAQAAGADQPPVMGRPGGGMSQRMMMDMDTDKDGAVTREEFMAAHQRADVRFAELDKNKDGAVSREEWLAEPPGSGRTERFKQLDSNGDGRITAQEMEARRTARFDAMDMDHDNRLTGQEMHAARESMMRQRSQLPNNR